MFVLLLLILPGVMTQDPTPSNFSPRPHQLPFNSVQFLQHKQAKNGPILFPNDAPPPPPTPLIVTSRPLSESIARSELNPNNSLAAQSQYHQVTYRPDYLARGKNYEPYSYTLATVAPVYDYASKIDYSDTATVQGRKENYYKDYEPKQESMGEKTDDSDTNNEIKVTDALYSNKASFNTNDSYYEDEFSEEDNNFDFDFTKLVETIGETRVVAQLEISLCRAVDSNRIILMKTQRLKIHNYSKHKITEQKRINPSTKTQIHKQFLLPKKPSRKKHTEPNSSEYLDYYPESKQTQRRQFSMLLNKKDFKIRPLDSLHKESIGDGWHRLSDHEKGPSNSAEEIEQIIGLPPRRSVMRNVKYRKNDLRNIVKYNKRDERTKKTLYDSGIGEQPQLRVVKPLYEINNVQRHQQNVAPMANPYKFKDTPDQLYHNKNNEDGHDYNKDNNHADNYAFSYTVKDHKTGDDFSHSQKSTGSATNGEYRVRLPDGRMQIVSYTADENGYKADVRYDEHHNQDNSIDFENDKKQSFRNNDIPKTYNYKSDNAHVVHQDSYENDEYLHRPLKPIPTTYKAPNNYEQTQFENINDYGNKNDNFHYYNVYPTKTAYAVTTGANINDRTFDGLSDNNNDYLDHYNTRLENNDGIDRAKNDYKFSDEIIDYSSELDQRYQPHKSKFSSFGNNQNTEAQAQVRPSYDELKDLFVTNVNGRKNAAITALPVVSTVRPVYAVTPENIVAITPKKPINNLYTNIKNIVSATPTPFLFSTPSPSTPRSYLLSTIANLKHQISLANKPVLSDQYINKINKYLSYSNPSKLSK